MKLPRFFEWGGVVGICPLFLARLHTLLIIEMVEKDENKKPQPSPALAYLNYAFAHPKEMHKYKVDYGM